jgi:transcriptional regulator with XRE-family HTH domain
MPPLADRLMQQQQQIAFYGQLVGQVLRGRREMQQLTLMTMAQSAALTSPSGWSRIESGNTSMTLVQLRKAARTLGITPADIVRQADLLASQLEASGVIVRDERPKDVGKWVLGGAGILALLAEAGVVAAASKAQHTTPEAGADTREDKAEAKKERS